MAVSSSSISPARGIAFSHLLVPSDTLCQARGLAPEEVRFLGPPVIRPAPGADTIRVMQLNVLADGLSDDGFLVSLRRACRTQMISRHRFRGPARVQSWCDAFL